MAVERTTGLPTDGSVPDGQSSQPRIGVFVCHCGGNISDTVDVEKVVNATRGLPGVAVVERNMFMCSDPGQQMIAEAVKNDHLDGVVVAACSPSLHEATFRQTLERAGLNPYLYEHVNIREQVSWVSKSDPQGATDKAIRLVAAGVAKAARLRPLQPVRVKAHQRVAVIGGGVAGLSCARDVAQLGMEVHLIERAPSLGGHVSELHRLYPTERKASDLLAGLYRAIRDEPRIKQYLATEVVSIDGYVGDFRVVLQGSANGAATQHDGDNGGRTILNVGVIVLATGFEPYQPRQGEYGYLDHPEVVTLPQLAEMLNPAGSTHGRLERNGRPVRNVAFIHCVGSRQIEGVHEPGPDGSLHPYCSRYCCTATLQAACEIRSRFPAVNVFDFYQDIRTYGRNHETYYENACQTGVTFFRYAPEVPPIVRQNDDARQSVLLVEVKDLLTFGKELAVPADLVVLSTGMVPRSIENLVELLKVPRGPDGFLQEVHPKLRPVETAVRGVLIAGTCQGPMDIQESCASAGAAAAKAASILQTGTIDLEPFVAQVDPSLCRGEGLCVEECEHQQAISLQDVEVDGVPTRRAEVNGALCTGCGMCVAVCPHGAIQVAGWQLNQFEAMVSALAGTKTTVGAVTNVGKP